MIRQSVCGVLAGVWLLLLVMPVFAAKPFNLLIIQTDEHHFSTLGCYGGYYRRDTSHRFDCQTGSALHQLLCDDTRLLSVTWIVSFGFVSAEDARRHQ